MPPTRRILRPIIEEHLEEAAFLRRQWEFSLRSPLLSLRRVASGPEERLHAHVEGLALALPAALEPILVSALCGDDPDSATVAALALLEEGSAAHVARVVARLEAEGPPEMVRALALSRTPSVPSLLTGLLASANPHHIVAALEVLTFRRHTPPDLGQLVSSSEPPVAAAALRAAPLLGVSAQQLVEFGLHARVPGVVEAAVESGLVLGMRSAWLAARRLIDEKQPVGDLVLQALALSGEDVDLDRLHGLLSDEARQMNALVALGASGRVRAAEVALSAMQVPALARVAGEAFSAITGLGIAGAFGLPEPAPVEEPVSFEDENLDADLSLKPEHLLPLPNPSAVATWWASHRNQFEVSVRYLAGQPMHPEVFAQAFWDGPMRRRELLGWEVTLRTHRLPSVPSNGWARAQLASPDPCRELRPESFLPITKQLRG